ncbi:MAG: 23S rRNA (guanosine(2251)-2'-O)-methyltransferase RlmB [Deltaproteobacteria bacterium]|nr:23S rRNA (guanosine(2251)-2'-O)-methyltransferase RlmB [Deltaproteobacteria bacterium]
MFTHISTQQQKGLTQIICGINAVNETLKQGKGVVELFVAEGRTIGRVREILDLARARGIPIRFKDRGYLDRLSPDTSHQGLVAVISGYTYYPMEDLMAIALSRKSKGLLVVTDHIMDAGNLGSLIRTAEFFGVHGLIIPKDRSASVTDIVHKRSAGGTAYLPVARVVNLARSLERMAEEGLWIVGTEGQGETSIYSFDWDRDVVIVLGSEGKGLSRVVRDRCHHLVRIPRLGHLESLNVSVAAGIILSEIARQRGNLTSS